MASAEEIYGVNHRRQKWLVAGASALALLLALAPRQERALFIIDGPPIRAFGATLPPINLAQILLPLYEGIDGGYPRVFGPLRSFLARGGVPGLPGVTPGGPAAPFVPPAGAPPGQAFPFGAPPVAPVPGPGIANPFPFPGGSVGPPTVSPVAPITDVVPPLPPVTPAIPEPATWATMIMGFLLAGLGLRRRRQSSSSRVLRKVTEPN